MQPPTRRLQTVSTFDKSFKLLKNLGLAGSSQSRAHPARAGHSFCRVVRFPLLRSPGGTDRSSDRAVTVVNVGWRVAEQMYPDTRDKTTTSAPTCSHPKARFSAVVRADLRTACASRPNGSRRRFARKRGLFLRVQASSKVRELRQTRRGIARLLHSNKDSSALSASPPAVCQTSNSFVVCSSGAPPAVGDRAQRRTADGSDIFAQYAACR